MVMNDWKETACEKNDLSDKPIKSFRKFGVYTQFRVWFLNFLFIEIKY